LLREEGTRGNPQRAHYFEIIEAKERLHEKKNSRRK